MNIDEIRTVDKELKRILPIFLQEKMIYMNPQKYFYLSKPENLVNMLKFGNGFGAWFANDSIHYAIRNCDFFEKIAAMPEFGQKKGTKLIKEEEFIENDKDYLDYFEYVIDNGLTELDYSLDVLPHEVMHLVGSHSGIIGEGMTELMTRRICAKYGIRCAPIMHTKETKFVIMLEKIFGEIPLIDAAFIGVDTCILEACERMFGEEFKNLYEDIKLQYREYMMDYSTEPLEHYKKYREIDFSKMYALLEQKIKNDSLEMI